MGRKVEDLTGRCFGKLTPIMVVGRTKHGAVRWLCKCDCGEQTTTTSGSLKSGLVRSCGCLRRTVSTKPGQYKGVTATVSGSYIARITVYLGRHETAIEAARAYDAAVRKYALRTATNEELGLICLEK